MFKYILGQYSKIEASIKAIRTRAFIKKIWRRYDEICKLKDPLLKEEYLKLLGILSHMYVTDAIDVEEEYLLRLYSSTFKKHNLKLHDSDHAPTDKECHVRLHEYLNCNYDNASMMRAIGNIPRQLSTIDVDTIDSSYMRRRRSAILDLFAVIAWIDKNFLIQYDYEVNKTDVTKQ